MAAKKIPIFVLCRFDFGENSKKTLPQRNFSFFFLILYQKLQKLPRIDTKKKERKEKNKAEKSCKISCLTLAGVVPRNCEI